MVGSCRASNLAAPRSRRGILQQPPARGEVPPIDDPIFYQDFFSRADKSLYLQKEHW